MDKIEKLGLEFLRECFNPDFDTGNLTWKKRPLCHFKDKRAMNSWNTRFAGKKAGSILKLKKQNTNYFNVVINGKKYRLHRIIFFMKYGYLTYGDKNMIDHIDRNGLNNSIDNLRLVTRSENASNCGVKKKYKNNTSGVKGISFDKNKNKWYVYIMVNKKRKHIGFYFCFKKAIKVLEEAKIKYNIK